MELASKLPTHALTLEQQKALLCSWCESLGILPKPVEKRLAEKLKQALEQREQERPKACVAALIDFLHKQRSSLHYKINSAERAKQSLPPLLSRPQDMEEVRELFRVRLRTVCIVILMDASTAPTK